jgi:RNA-directed DNA polymerase
MFSVINSKKFLAAQNHADFCMLFRLPFQELEMLINEPPYTEHVIPKSKGGKRQLAAPSKQLKVLQKQINYCLQYLYNTVIPECVHGFVLFQQDTQISRGIVTNAAAHTNKQYVLNIDLKDFFHSISASKVKMIFKQAPFNFSDDIAIVLALLCTYKKCLPMGAPTSPVLSNFACLEMDNQLMQLCKSHEITYTRYADDLTFSGNHTINESFVNDIKALIASFGFSVNNKKTRLQSLNGKQCVTGIKVNEKTNVSREYIQLTKAMLHHWETYGIYSAVTKHFKLKHFPDEAHKVYFINRLGGRINFIASVRGKYDAISVKMKNRYYLLTKQPNFSD